MLMILMKCIGESNSASSHSSAGACRDRLLLQHRRFANILTDSLITQDIIKCSFVWAHRLFYTATKDIEACYCIACRIRIIRCRVAFSVHPRHPCIGGCMPWSTAVETPSVRHPSHKSSPRQYIASRVGDPGHGAVKMNRQKILVWILDLSSFMGDVCIPTLSRTVSITNKNIPVNSNSRHVTTTNSCHYTSRYNMSLIPYPHGAFLVFLMAEYHQSVFTMLFCHSTGLCCQHTGSAHGIVGHRSTFPWLKTISFTDIFSDVII